MRRWVGLLLSALGLLAAAPAAGAATFTSPSPQEALDLASDSPGPDDVVLGPDDYELSTGLVYSDRGQADNHVSIRAGESCSGGKYQQCRRTELGGGSPGTVLLSFTGGGGADVAVSRILFEPRNGATALALPPGGIADNVSVLGEGESTGIRLEGTPSRPAIVRNFSSAFGSVAVDAPGHGVVENTRLEGGVGARSSGTGSLDIRGGSITARTGVTGPRVKVTGTLIDFGDPARTGGGQPVGIDTRCAGPGSADAEATVTNATIVGYGQPGTIGVRALGRGGDGDGCNATVRLSSTIVHAAGVSLDASGEAGSGADPRDGVARIEAAYSNFVLETMRQSGPAQFQTSSPGHNVYGDPGLVPGYRSGQLLWSSPLVDAGDPAPLEGWQEFWIKAVHGRRDVGAVEYGFNSPHLTLGIYPGRVVARDALVLLNADRFDHDPGDPLARMEVQRRRQRGRFRRQAAISPTRQLRRPRDHH